MTNPVTNPAARATPPSDVRLGAPVLRVSDLGRSVAFYRDGLGFRVSPDGQARARLTAGDDPTVLLVLDAAAPAVAPPHRVLGLFHVAFLLPDRAALGRLLAHLHATGIPLGASDHDVSEALYLADPDGLGLEVYADRPRSAWRTVGGERHMTTAPLDVASLRTAAGETPWRGMPGGTRVGHLHLSVDDLDVARRRFADVVGLTPTVTRYPGALFLAADGYHHHLGTNTWQGRAARAAGEDEARLLEWSMLLTGADASAALEAIAVRAADVGVPITRERADTLELVDEWGVTLRIGAMPER